MVMDATRTDRPADTAGEEARARRRAAFRRGFLGVWRRAFSLDFSPIRRPADTRPGRERDAEAIRGYWENVGGYIRRAMAREEARHILKAMSATPAPEERKQARGGGA